jgi:hypothetical protein
MADKSDRRAARDTVAAYHEASLTALARHVCDAADQFRAGALDVSGLDRVIHQYHRASQELWKFCALDDAEFTSSLIAQGAPIDWWDRGARQRS